MLWCDQKVTEQHTSDTRSAGAKIFLRFIIVSRSRRYFLFIPVRFLGFSSSLRMTTRAEGMSGLPSRLGRAEGHLGRSLLVRGPIRQCHLTTLLDFLAPYIPLR